MTDDDDLALVEAIWMGDCETIVRMAVNPHKRIKTSLLGMVTQIRYAIHCHHLPLVQLFHRMGADLEEQIMVTWGDRKVAYLLDYATWWDTNYEIVAYLWEHGARYDPTYGRSGRFAKLMESYEARITAARQATTILLSKQLRMQLRVPRDVMNLVARVVWSTRRLECWE